MIRHDFCKCFHSNGRRYCRCWCIVCVWLYIYCIHQILKTCVSVFVFLLGFPRNSEVPNNQEPSVVNYQLRCLQVTRPRTWHCGCKFEAWSSCSLADLTASQVDSDRIHLRALPLVGKMHFWNCDRFQTSVELDVFFWTMFFLGV